MFRRQAIDRGANILDVDHIVTGHNADDVAETVLMNGMFESLSTRGVRPAKSLTRLARLLDSVLRGDMPRLQRCTAITTGQEASPSSSSSSSTAASATTATGSCKRSAATDGDVDDDLEAEEEALDNLLPKTIKRSKPFKYVYEKEIVMYAYFKVSSFPRVDFLKRGSNAGY